ncbi:TPT-domain-containing protein [Neoconidiobolus thromboides FSU 785]|nr:TPT-domain-containing protein [Neoconidiobolus thromboides FSU 785]
MYQTIKNKLSLNAIKILLCIITWFACSAGLSSINKILFGAKYNNFKYPLLSSSFHACFHFFLSYFFINYLQPSQFPNFHNTGTEFNDKKVVSFFEKDFWLKVAPCAIAGGLEISTCNAALMFVTLSFYTVIKSTVPIWVLLFSFILKLEKVRVQLILIIVLICVGVALASINNTTFNLLGFILILVGSISSGIKWCLTQILLQNSELGLDHPIITLYKVAPVMSVFMFICSLFFEDILNLPSHMFATNSHTYLPSWTLVLIGGLIAFLMTLAEFGLIQLTSTLTMSITGISKEVMMIAISVLLFKDTLSLLNYFGLIISIIGIGWYNYFKYQQKKANYQPLQNDNNEEGVIHPHLHQ